MTPYLMYPFHDCHLQVGPDPEYLEFSCSTTFVPFNQTEKVSPLACKRTSASSKKSP